MNGFQVVLFKQECHIHLMECNIEGEKSLSTTKPNYFVYFYLLMMCLVACVMCTGVYKDQKRTLDPLEPEPQAYGMLNICGRI